MIAGLRKKLFFSIGLMGVVYLVFTLYADYELVLKSFSSFPIYLVPVLLILTFTNYLSRFLKWDYYINLLGVRIKKIDSFSIFMSGLIMSVTPGKMGELLKAYLVKKISGEPVSKTAPVILIERVTDFVSLILIALAGAYFFDYGRVITIVVGIFFIGIIAVISKRNLSMKIIELLTKISFLHKYRDAAMSAYESSYLMLKAKPLILMTLLSLVSWSFECFGYYLILTNFGIDTSMFWASFTYAFSTIIGAVSMLPGGLGITDGSLTFLLTAKGISLDTAVASTFVIRVVTLWFAVLVGIISVWLYQKRFGQISNDFLTKINEA